MAAASHLVGNLWAFSSRRSLGKEQETSREHQKKGNDNLLEVRHCERNVNVPVWRDIRSSGDDTEDMLPIEGPQGYKLCARCFCHSAPDIEILEMQ